MKSGRADLCPPSGDYYNSATPPPYGGRLDSLGRLPAVVVLTSAYPYLGGVTPAQGPPARNYNLDSSIVQGKRWKGLGKDGALMKHFGKSLVTQEFLEGLVRDGKVASLDAVQRPLGIEELHPHGDETIIFDVYFDVGICFPCAKFVAEVFRLYT